MASRSRSIHVSHGPGAIAPDVAVGRDARAEVALQVAHLGLAADRAVPGHDHVGELDHDVEHVGPHRGIALERERRHAEEAEVAGEADVAVGDEHEQVARGVARRGEQLDARGVSCAAPSTRWVTGRVPSSARSSNSSSNAGMNCL